MKKILLILIFSTFLCQNSLADICYEINQETINRAFEILKHQKTIYDYCSICNDAKLHKITITKIEPNNPFLINGKAIDLAHTYYKKDNSYINLGIATGCIADNQYGIKAQIPNLPDTHRTKEISEAYAKEETKKIYETCQKRTIPQKEHLTTTDMIIQNISLNDCIVAYIKQEIITGFDVEKQNEILEHLQQVRKNLLSFYNIYYSYNKYCEQGCGSISTLLPYIDENKLLTDLLEQLLFLNNYRNGY